jgi:tetratricopeptide (TPR) repeat protein
MRPISRWFPFLILTAGVIAYANSFPGPFIFDDSRVILDNPHLYTLWPPWRAVLVPTRWVADLSFAMNYALSGTTPADFRMTNVLIHIVAGWLLYGVVRRTLRLPRFQERFGSVADPLAFIAALLWVVHPLQTESITYIAQRIEALMGLFVLLVFYCFIRGLDSPRPRLWMNAALAACVVGMGTKEVMATAPILALLYDGWSAASWREALRRRWKAHAAFFLSIGVFAMLFLLSVAQALEVDSLYGKGVAPWKYACTQTEVILHYLRLSVLPTSLCLSYRWPVVQAFGDVWPAALAMAALGLLTAWGLVRRAAFAFPLAWVFVILAPTSSVLPLSDVAFEHRMYLPLAGVVALLVVGSYALLDRGSRPWLRHAARHRALAVLLALAVAAWFTTLTRARNLDYRSVETMWQDVLAKRPDNHRVRVALSSALIDGGRLDEAAAMLTNLLARLPDMAKMSNAEICSRQARDPMLPTVEYAMAHNNLGIIGLNRAQWDSAEAHFRETIRIWPANRLGYYNMGRVAAYQSQTDASLTWLKIALLKKPDDVDTLCFLAASCDAIGDYTNAAAYYERTLLAKPDHTYALSQLAWLLATTPDAAIRDGPRAVRLARRLPALSGDASAHAYDVLGAALAEAGRFDEAIAMAERALALRRRGPSPDPAGDALAKRIEQRLQLYRRHEPYRDAR